MVKLKKLKIHHFILFHKVFFEGINGFPKDIEIGIKYLEYGLKEKDIKTMELY